MGKLWSKAMDTPGGAMILGGDGEWEERACWDTMAKVYEGEVLGGSVPV